MATEPLDLTPEQRAAEDRTFRRGAALAVGVVLVAGIVLGFVVLPVVQGASVGLDAWSAICRAIGVQPGTPIARQPSSEAAATPVSQVSWGPATLGALRNGNVARGAQLSRVCDACHGAQGLSSDPQFPNMSGQTAYAIYKQLHDFRSGARKNYLMSIVATYRSDQSIADLAVYYASRQALQHGSIEDPVAANLAVRGDPARSIAACNACHLGNPGAPVETPNLIGQHKEYLLNQLQAFAHDTRHNDVYARMRTISTALTSDEMERLAAYYAATPRP
ncbi:c-type cytochrome [Limobrevibacterium gyesilva]|uniref:C-type cytochrome n=1 Tax=Limobrevibacterium gyesilva TaxID=2991712 RepID=A0AA41YWU0_9PROT|nr:c-type cytochrome [Limobrevibacterium gyesilva]MCW3477835.1 c-type cytochrome [Limobrevibacterium gyesilva]